MIKFLKNKIDAVKALRELAPVEPITVEKIEGRQITLRASHIPGLKDSKDFVEACMMFGVREFLKNPKHFVETMGDPLTGEAPIGRFNYALYTLTTIGNCESCFPSTGMWRHRCLKHGSDL